MEPNSNVREIVLKCWSCSALFDEDNRHPRLLPCLHSICFQCLQSKIESKTKIRCTYCEEEIDFNNKLVDEFPSDGTKSGFVKLYKMKNSEHLFQCQECEDKQKAEFLCETCSKQLCYDCHEHHKRAKRSHVLCSIQDIPLTFESTKKFLPAKKCQMKGHEEEILTFHCNSCKKAVCSRCILISHKEGHNVKELHEVYETEAQKIENEKLSLDEIGNRIENIVELVESEIVNVEETSYRLSLEVEEAFQKKVAILKDRKDELIKEIKQNRKSKKKRLIDQLTQLNKQKNTISKTQSFLQLTLSTADSVSLIETSHVIIKKALRIKHTPIDTAPCEKPTLRFFETSFVTTPLLGKVTSTSVYGPRTRVFLPKVSYVGEETEIKVSLFDYDGNVVNDQELNVSLQIHDSNNEFVHSVDCHVTDEKIWVSKDIFYAAGRYEIAVTVLGVKLEMETVIIAVESLPVKKSAQIPVFQTLRMTCNSTIQVKNVDANLSDEDIIRHFQNNKKSGGGKLQKFSRVENVVYITYQDETVLREVLSKRQRICRNLLTVSKYVGPVLKVPDPISLNSFNEIKTEFLQSSDYIRHNLEEGLTKLFAKIVWPDECQNEPAVYCMLSYDTPKYEILVENWSKEVNALVTFFMDKLFVRQISVPFGIWERLIDALRYINVSQPKNVSVVLRRKRESIHVVGLRTGVNELETLVKKILKELLLEQRENKSSCA